MPEWHCEKCGVVVVHIETHSEFHRVIDTLAETAFIGDRKAQPGITETTYHKSDTHHE